MGWRRVAGAAGLALLTAACMAGPPRGPGPGGFGRPGDGPGGDGPSGDGPMRPREQLFISPSGQPFRAPPGQPYPSAAWFAAADRDGDGRLTRDEFRADALAWFAVLDRNGDGQIGMPEVTWWEEETVPEITREDIAAGPGSGRRPSPRGGNAGSRRQGAAFYSLINEPHPIRGADADFSMGVSRAEWLAAADRRFRLLDLDGDGIVLATDLRPTPAQVMSGAQGGPRGDPRRR
ncbi:EF-hand domain-containing protein [Phenylobacterium sp. SCN 70-31]|uniref:EF-hand domain-containing protein n=1 Tax=Phenylobacterium sp. SCN 70-31 TaxID=1660129 RepID=UPI00086BD312|nr:EF-hand domain-containing protein [Phenylobacterium sp. SCN 70-31]ODT89809.1 MAG: hypothetical protein ABS78_00285 [Phenylobacterium sp. SCN 70-31]